MANDVSLLLDAGSGIEARAAADVVVPVLGITPLPVVGTPSTPNLLGALPSLFEGSDALARLYFGVKADAVLAGNGTVTGTDNADALNNYAAWCRDRGRAIVLPPGNYYLTKPLTIYTDFDASGVRLLFPSNVAGPNRVIVENRPEDVLTIPLSEVRAWTSCTKLSRKIGGLTGRKGQYIIVDTPDEALINRRGANPGDAPTPLRMGEGFLVADDTGGLAHSLYATWNNAAWTSAGSYTAKIVRSPIKIEGLSVVLCGDGTSTVVNAPVLNRRPNTVFSGCSVENVSGVQVAQGFSDEGCCLVTHEDGWVKGLLVDATNYGWNSNLCAGLVYRRPKEINCRRGIDAHRSKNITIESPDLPDGWGAHYSWWMGSSGGTLGASTANNPQAINVAGGGFYCTDARISISGDATAVARIRADYMECDEQIDLSDCVVDFASQAAGVFLIDAVGTASAYDFGRNIRYPARIDLTRLIVNLIGPATQILYPVNWLRGYSASDLPRMIGVDSAWDIDLKVNFGAGSAYLADGTTPRVQVGYNKPSQAVGAGVSARVRGLPALALTAYAPADAVTATARLVATLSQIPTVFLRYGPGGYRLITTDATSLDQATLSNAVGFTPIGDEAVRPAASPTPATQGRLSYSNSNLVTLGPVGGWHWVNGMSRPIPANVTLAPTGLTAGSAYYVYTYMDGAAMKLETSATAPVIGSAGVWVKNGDATRSLVGMVGIDTGGTFGDSPAKRLVVSRYNQPARPVEGGYNTGSTASTSAVEISTSFRVTFVTFSDQCVDMTAVGGSYSNQAGGGTTTLVGLDGTQAGMFTSNTSGSAGQGQPAYARATTRLGDGIHTATLMGYASSGATSSWFAKIVGSLAA